MLVIYIIVDFVFIVKGRGGFVAEITYNVNI